MGGIWYFWSKAYVGVVNVFRGSVVAKDVEDFFCYIFPNYILVGVIEECM
jgi:hypothetical protein